jgi:hypothetical protein
MITMALNSSILPAVIGIASVIAPLTAGRCRLRKASPSLGTKFSILSDDGLGGAR